MTIEQRRLKLVILLIIAIFIIIPIFIFIISSSKNSINIDNYNDYAKNLPSSQRELINDALYRAVELNFMDGEDIIASSASIRQNTSTSTYNEDADVHSGTFIVDLPKIEQSYFVSYDWSEDPDNPNVSGYPSRVLCLTDSSQIIYEDFKCTDGSEDSNLSLEFQLPYTDINGPFRIIYMFKQGDSDVIGIENSTPDGRLKALEWLRSKNINPENVIIYYLDLTDQLRSFNYET